MSLTYLRVLLCRNDVQIIVICTATGGLLQIISKSYLKSHPEFLEDQPVKPVTKKRYRRPRFWSPRGGALIEISFVSLKIVLNFLAKKGLLAGLLTGSGLVISKIPAAAVSTYLRDAFPQNLPHLEKKKFILVHGEKIYLDQCDQNLHYLFLILEDETIPFEEKQKVARSILTKYLDLQTLNGRIAFVLCIGFMLYILSIQNPSSYYILLQNLLEAIKEGRISKALARALVRRLKRRGVPISPELVEVINS
jgi:hypothetical protein